MFFFFVLVSFRYFCNRRLFNFYIFLSDYLCCSFCSARDTIVLTLRLFIRRVYKSSPLLYVLPININDKGIYYTFSIWTFYFIGIWLCYECNLFFYVKYCSSEWAVYSSFFNLFCRQGTERGGGGRDCSLTSKGKSVLLGRKSLLQVKCVDHRWGWELCFVCYINFC